MVMSIKHENPYREGQYREIFGFVMKKQCVTRADLLKFTVDTFGGEKPADVTVLLSPRKSSKRGDCRGNISAQGHLYYMEKLSRQTKLGIKEPQRFRLKWRGVAMEPRKRVDLISTEAEKVVSKAEVKSPVKSKVKSTVKA